MPSLAEALLIARDLHQAGRYAEAEHVYRQVLEVDPSNVDAWNLWGVLAFQAGQHKVAVERIQRAIAAMPEFADAHYNLGNAWLAMEKLDEALASFQQALHLDPAFPQAYANLGSALKDQGRLPEAIAAYRRAIELRPGFATAHSALLFALHFAPGYDAAAIYEQCRRWNADHAAPFAEEIRPHANDRSASRRLRIGYVSPDFYCHCQAHFMLPLLSSHDRSQFEIFCYSNVVQPDEITAHLRSLTDGWRDIAQASDEEAAEIIRQDKIDILVDLTMHMASGRLFVFARKPAPVQVTWLAYPGTTGLTTIDYRLTDPWLDPPDMFDRDYSEASVRLPETFWCYDPLLDTPVTGLPALETGYVTFGGLNNFCKVNAAVIQLWARVLKAVEGSRLLILAPEGSCRLRVLEEFIAAGVAAERIEFVGRQPRAPYMQTYQRIDIGLDTLPYNGHTTSLDALWMGVPVVSIVGATVVGRAGLSQLSNLGLTELVASDGNEFVRIAAELASDYQRLSELRKTLRGRMEASPLMDAPGFARNMEAAYRSMWQHWCAQPRSYP